MNFPNRPDHPDFWLMAEIVQDLDAAADDRIALERILGPVDAASLAYMAEQRGLRAAMFLSRDRMNLAMAAAWVDAFKAGMEFQKRRKT